MTRPKPRPPPAPSVALVNPALSAHEVAMMLPPAPCACHVHAAGPPHVRNDCDKCWSPSSADAATPGVPSLPPPTMDAVLRPTVPPTSPGGNDGAWPGASQPSSQLPASQPLTQEMRAVIEEKRRAAAERLRLKREQARAAGTPCSQ